MPLAFLPPLLLLLSLASCLTAAEGGQPVPDPAEWGSEPVEVQGTGRATICLNGRWRFRPGDWEPAPAANEWGLLRVPGAWATRGHPLPAVEVLGAGPRWAGLERDSNRAPAWNQVDRGLYERPLLLPADWTGRQVVLELRRVGTDAVVRVDGVEAGRVASPEGSIDLTPLLRAGTLRPGVAARLTIGVLAAASPDAVTVVMGGAPDQVFTRKAELRCRGLLGDVLLTSVPDAPRCADVFVRPSVRHQRVDLDLELAGVADGTLRVAARMLAPDGSAEREFSGETTVADGRATIGWPWADARRWDLGRPELYTLDLRVSGSGIDDRLRVEFGFKELWIEGRRMLLNGSEVHLRPYTLVNEEDRDWGMAELIDGAIAGMRSAGFDCQELWPWDQAERGVPAWHDLWYERAKRAGWGMIAPLQDARQILGKAWRDPLRRAAWEERVRAQVKRQRNNPAILLWVHTPNVYGRWDDQDPRLLGRQSVLAEHSAAERQDLVPGLEGNAFIRGLDPTRPVTTHHGGAVGDIHTANTYPCLAQPQEQQEWLSTWARDGEVPFWAIEYGPFILDYRRGRLTGGWGQDFGAIHTELQATEQLAAWYGRAAYAAETPAMRALNPKYFVAGQRYRAIPDSWRNDLAEEHMGEQLGAAMRAWRTLGASFLPVPWEAEWGWLRTRAADGSDSGGTRDPAPPFAPGRRGLWFPTLTRSMTNFMRPAGATPLARAKALAASNSPLLAWICAPPVEADPGAVTAKDHAYAAGAPLAKALAVLNDARADAACRATWRITLDGREIAHDERAWTMATGTREFVPLAADLPAMAPGTGLPAAGLIEAEVAITLTGGVKQVIRDSFAFQVFPPAPVVEHRVRLADPEGSAARLCAALGATVDPAAPVAVIGRRALSSGAVDLATYEPWVRNGGRLLVLAQDPEWLRRTVGWRVGHQVLRRVFPVDSADPLLAGMAVADLRDWRGAGTLVEAYPVLDAAQRGPSRYPAHAWHHGNRGSVCSAPIEKPHRSGWRPLMECDFDLAWTPLMELDHGRGRITWCQLDLEDRQSGPDRDDPAALRLAANLLDQVARAPLTDQAGTARYLGAPADREFLATLGVEFSDDARAPLVVGQGADPAEVAKRLAAGERVVALDGMAVGLATSTATGAGSLVPPAWPVLRGLSPGDLRLSCDGPQKVVTGADPAWEVAADGLFARRRAGDALLCLADPRSLPADEKTYFRTSRWRRTHALCLALANSGVGFAADARIWHLAEVPPPEPDGLAVPLAGSWAARQTIVLPPAGSSETAHRDGGPSPVALAAAQPGFADADWERRDLPGSWATWGGTWASGDGEGVFRRHFTADATLLTRPLELVLGPIDDFDTVWINGVQVGATGIEVPEFWSRPRVYPLPPGAVKAGDNTIVIRVFDRFGGASIGVVPSGFGIRAPPLQRRDGWYHPDYETRHEVADDPHRYYRW